MHFWAIHKGPEVDFILDEEIAIEVKAINLVADKHLRGLKSLAEERSLKRQILVSRDKKYRRIGKIEIYPYQLFLEKLWTGELW